MFAIAFDLDTKATEIHHPRGVVQAYKDIARCLSDYGFQRVQGSVYLTSEDTLVNLFDAVQALRQLPWLPDSVRDIRAFKVEHWSDFTPSVKSPQRS